MIKPLTDYLRDTTPFLRRVFITGNDAGIKGYAKFGYGPRIGPPPGGAKLAEDSEHTLVSHYIDSWIRAEIYKYACVRGFSRIEKCGCTLIPQPEQLYPLRADAAGKPVDPLKLLVSSEANNARADVNPDWISAPQEFLFGVTEDALRLSGNVTRAFRTDHWFFQIRLSMSIPQDAVCVELRPRDLTK